MMFDEKRILLTRRQKLEETTLELQETADALEQEKDRTDQLLHSIMPAKVVAQLKAGEKVHETFEQVTGKCMKEPMHICFAGLVYSTRIR